MIVLRSKYPMVAICKDTDTMEKKMPFQDRQYDRGPREMYKAVCADCKKECEVPFKPREDRPVYCRDCFPKHKTNKR